MPAANLSIRMTAHGWRLEQAGVAEDAHGTRHSRTSPRVLTSGIAGSSDFSPAAVLCWDDFASTTDRDALYDHVCASAADYEPSRVYGRVADGEIDEIHRKSMVNADDPWIRERMLPRLAAPIEVARRFFGIERIPLGRTELQVTASGAGDFFTLHCDDGSPDRFARMLTFVYYLHGEPRRFSGGDLHVFDSQRVQGAYLPAATHVAIEPRDNRLIVFPSDRYHEVTRVDGSTPAFGDRRITVNGWMWAQDGALPPRGSSPGPAD